MLWVKICGTTNLEDARAAADAGANAVGFVFAESPRRIDPKQAAEIVAQLPSTVEKVGVFVNERPARIREIVKQVGLTTVQLYGEEAADFAGRLFTEAEPEQRPRVYRALSMKTIFSAANATAFLRAHRVKQVFDALLVDSGSSTRGGGTGLTFDWERARPFITGLKKTGKVIVAGGLTPENVARAIEMFRPWGVDVASGVEKEPGRKDHEKIRAFVAAARRAVR
jgi:phosphoribosylanthranilate isomerase